jgi:glyoxylase-like metal-dependent hydrolase (beta-lactamase superfamily II)
MEAQITPFFDQTTFTVTYVVADPTSGHAAIIDPVLDYDPKSGRIATTQADAVLAHVKKAGLTIDWILETHIHADHLSAGAYLKDKLGGRTGIGENVKTVQATFKGLFNAEPAFASDGSQFDHLFHNGEHFTIGALAAEAIHTPGHTPACMSYLIGDALFVGDTLFMPDYGTARCDFPGGDATTLYRSIQRILALPPETRLFMCHDYMPGGRPARWESTVAEERAKNIHIHEGVSEQAFVQARVERDKTLSMPVLILPSVQINMRAGHLPPPEDNGISYLKIPIDAL